VDKTTVTRLAGATALSLTLALSVSVPAQAGVQPDKTAKGTCTLDSNIKLKAKTHHDDVRVKAKVKTQQGSEAWAWVITDNGLPAAEGTDDTAKNGKLTVRESIPNLEGPDMVNFTATDTVTGEVCTADVTLNK
jgi:hypothetical protein